MKKLISLVLLGGFVSGCALSQLISKAKREDEMTRRVWQQARAELRLTCIQTPDVCQHRWLMKIPRQGHISLADWEYDNFPPYQTVIDSHERRFREAKAAGWRTGDFEDLWLNEEILFAIARTLAKRSDDGDITPEQMKTAFTEAWNKTLKTLEQSQQKLLKALGDKSVPSQIQLYGIYAVFQHDLYHAGQIAILKKSSK